MPFFKFNGICECIPMLVMKNGNFIFFIKLGLSASVLALGDFFKLESKNPPNDNCIK
ncbi:MULTISPECIES: hypothetical protein [unclassified Campylobacter]|uniref:hypothetical protein n=1 Tax=unclassified Campylobacter TaxID=2593542 RepID=UPI00168090C4|nr:MULTISPECIES: hypothetical protein [unclassified Campylobacter]